MACSDLIRDGFEVEPSLDAAGFMRLGAQIERPLAAGADLLAAGGAVVADTDPAGAFRRLCASRS